MMPTESDYAEWAEVFESGEYRATPIEPPDANAARFVRGRPPKPAGTGEVAEPSSPSAAGNLRPRGGPRPAVACPVVGGDARRDHRVRRTSFGVNCIDDR